MDKKLERSSPLIKRLFNACREVFSNEDKIILRPTPHNDQYDYIVMIKHDSPNEANNKNSVKSMNQICSTQLWIKECRNMESNERISCFSIQIDREIFVKMSYMCLENFCCDNTTLPKETLILPLIFKEDNVTDQIRSILIASLAFNILKKNNRCRRVSLVHLNDSELLNKYIAEGATFCDQSQTNTIDGCAQESNFQIDDNGNYIFEIRNSKKRNASDCNNKIKINKDTENYKYINLLYSLSKLNTEILIISNNKYRNERIKSCLEVLDICPDSIHTHEFQATNKEIEFDEIYKKMEINIRNSVNDKQNRNEHDVDNIVSNLTQSAIKLKFCGLSNNKSVTCDLNSERTTFVLYNAARLKSIITKYHERSNHTHTSIDALNQSDMSNLTGEDEWHFVLFYIFNEESIVTSCMEGMEGHLQFHSNEITNFLTILSKKISQYLSKTRILVDNEQLMNSRVKLVNELIAIYNNLLNLLQISCIPSM